MKKRTMLVMASILSTAASLSAQSTNNGTTSVSKVRPVVGMTEAKAREYYGEPFIRTALKDGERWYYRLKFNEVYGRAFVPFYYDSPNVRWGSIDFGTNGRAQTFDWRTPPSR